MAIKNSSTIQRGIRILIAHDEHLQQKALKNPDNKHNELSVEINNLIAADYEKAQRAKRR